MDEKTKGHIETLNREMGIVQTDVSWLKKEMAEIKEAVKSTKRLVVGSILVPIALYLIKLVV